MNAPDVGALIGPPSTGRSSLVEAYLARSGMFTPGVGDPRRYDEMTGTDGSLLPGWTDLAAELDAIGGPGLTGLTGRVDRLLEDDGVTYTPVAGVAGDPDAPTADPERWRLDPLPLVVEDAEWTRLEAGLIQRSTLLDAILTDVYGPTKLIDNGLLPPELIYQHPDYLRPAHGITIPGAHQLFFHAVDVCRSATGEFQALGDRTQAPSGAGYAMADRRVVSRVLPDLFRRSAPRGLGAFFHTMRSALASVAPNEAEDPRVVVLTPGTHSETAFDQAMLASLLGVPLVESADLTIRRGRLWMRSMGRFEPVDVVVRRVDAFWSDPLDLKPGSRLGVVGLAEACRRGTVTVVNTLGSGVLESPGLAPFLPRLARAVLGETLKMPSVPTFWCGDDTERSHVLTHLEQMVIRPTGRGKSVFPAAMTRAEQENWRLRLEAEPTRWVGQQLAPFSEAPMAAPDGLIAGQVSMRLFTVAHGSGYVAMPGSLGRVQDGELSTAGRGRSSVAKDVWVRTGRAEVPDRREGRVWLYEGPLVQPDRPDSTSSPRVLEDMFWLGRYAERTEDLTRLLIVARERVDDFRFRPEHLGAGCVPVMLSAVTEVSGTRGFYAGADPLLRVRDLMLDATEVGTVAQSLYRLREAARSVRDQLSGDTWMVLGATDRAVAELSDTVGDGGMALSSTQAAVLVRHARAVRAGQREHGPRPRLVLHGHRPPAGTGPAGDRAAAVHPDPLAQFRGRFAGHRIGAGGQRIRRHLPPPVPGPDPGRHHARTAAARCRATRGRWPTRWPRPGPTSARCPTPPAPPGRSGGWRTSRASCGAPARRTSNGSTSPASGPNCASCSTVSTNPSAASPMPLRRSTSGTRARCSRWVSSPSTG